MEQRIERCIPLTPEPMHGRINGAAQSSIVDSNFVRNSPHLLPLIVQGDGESNRGPDKNRKYHSRAGHDAKGGGQSLDCDEAKGSGGDEEGYEVGGVAVRNGHGSKHRKCGNHSGRPYGSQRTSRAGSNGKREEASRRGEKEEGRH